MNQPGVLEMHQSTTSYCDSCGYQNPGNLSSCFNCDAPLELKCPVCGQAAPAESKFCSQCGAHLPQSRPAPAVSPRLDKVKPYLEAYLPTALAEKIKLASVKLEGERREVTVLFLDMTNFMVAAYRLGSEDVYLLIDEVMSLLIEVVYKYEGTIDKFIGDGLMAVFGAPVAHENDPERAIRAAMDMLAVIQPLQARLRQTHAFDFHVQIGLNTGPVIAGKLGNRLHMEYTLMGDTVNLVSQLGPAAEPGNILVNAKTYQRTRHLFEFLTLPALTVKGISQPVQVYRPLGLLEQSETVRNWPGRQAPMIGRATEMDSLQNALAQVRQQQRRRLVFITGEAGLGKSRLVAEFCRSQAGSDTRVYQGHCLTYARSTPLRVVAEMLRDMAGLAETGSSQAQPQALLAYLNRLNLPQAEILPYLTYVLGLEQANPEIEERLRLLDAPMLQQQTHAALRQLFLAEARRGATVLIFEDLHWVDLASRDFLEYLIQTTADAPLLLILVSRQVEAETSRRPLLAAARPEPDQLVELPLSPLSEGEGHLLVDPLIPQTTPEAAALKLRMVERAHGNPYYLEEIMQMLLDRGGLLRSPAGGAWQVTPLADQLLSEVPDTVQGLLMARLDRLPEGIRQTLQKTAVLGVSFPVSLLFSLGGLSPQTLAAHLEALEAGQFLSPAPFHNEPGYVFRHALLQETVCSTLLKQDRGKIHHRVAQAIQQSPFWLPEEQTEALAYHYARSTEPTQAIPHLIAAAENAARRCANETAVRHYRQAMNLLPAQPLKPSAGIRPDDPSQKFFTVRIGLGQSLKYVGEFAAAKQIVSEGLPYLWNSNLAEDPASLWPILVESFRQLADIEQREGAYNEALAHLEAGLQVLGETGPDEQPKLWCSLLERMAWIHFRQGQLKDAAAIAVAAAEGLNSHHLADPILLAALLNTLGGVHWQQGELDQATTFVEQSLQLYQSMGYFWGMAIALGNLGILSDIQGRWPQAANYYQQAYDLHQITGDLQNQASNLDNLGTLHLAMGEHQKANQELEAGLSIRRRLGDTWGTAQSQVNLARLALLQNRLKDSTLAAEAALTLADTIGSSEIQVEAFWILALAQAENGELPMALPLAEQALEQAQKAGLTEKEGECLRVLGVLQARAGQLETAEALLRRSMDLSIKQNDPYRQGQALLELGRLYQRQAQADQPAAAQGPAEALSALGQAAQLFETLGAVYDLQLAQTALAQVKTSATAVEVKQTYGSIPNSR